MPHLINVLIATLIVTYVIANRVGFVFKITVFTTTSKEPTYLNGFLKRASLEYQLDNSSYRQITRNYNLVLFWTD
ncbi:hypothetical protein GCM10022291_00220 [Postechiella marina]|uniref:Uncharacterized protein n=1 Tax=Postechiella marina TaxID=943941 RepID=A0ABP8BYS2_9FLAO